MMLEKIVAAAPVNLITVEDIRDEAYAADRKIRRAIEVAGVALEKLEALQGHAKTLGLSFADVAEWQTARAMLDVCDDLLSDATESTGKIADQLDDPRLSFVL